MPSLDFEIVNRQLLANGCSKIKVFPWTVPKSSTPLSRSGHVPNWSYPERTIHDIFAPGEFKVLGYECKIPHIVIMWLYMI